VPRRRPSIRHTEHGWTLTRPGYGFSRDHVTHYPTWDDARASLIDRAIHGGGSGRTDHAEAYIRRRLPRPLAW
jgi:hypothetical protein